MITKNLFNTFPLELSRFKRNVWINSGYECFAIVDEKEIVKQYTLEYTKYLFNQTNGAFVVIWDFGFDLENLWCKENFQSIKLIRDRADLLIYEILDEREIELFLDIWGEMDSMDFVFPKDNRDFVDATSSREFSTFNRFRKSFLKRVFSSIAIISDSGDGEESQFVMDRNVRVRF